MKRSDAWWNGFNVLCSCFYQIVANLISSKLLYLNSSSRTINLPKIQRNLIAKRMEMNETQTAPGGLRHYHY